MPIMRRPPEDAREKQRWQEPSGEYLVGRRPRESTDALAETSDPAIPTSPASQARPPDPRVASRPAIRKVSNGTIKAQTAATPPGPSSSKQTQSFPKTAAQPATLVSRATAKAYQQEADPSGVRRYGTVQMAAVRFEVAPEESEADGNPAPSSGRMLDDLDFLDPSHPDIALELKREQEKG